MIAELAADIQVWAVRPVAWGAFGIGLCIVEIFTGAMIALPLGLAALVTAVLVWLGILTSWQSSLVVFGLLGIGILLVLRRIYRKTTKDVPDINKY